MTGCILNIVPSFLHKKSDTVHCATFIQPTKQVTFRSTLSS
jgi:hypothetical protein